MLVSSVEICGYVYEISCINIWCLFYAEKRRAEASRIREKYPDRIPVRTQLYFKNHVLGVLTVIFVCPNFPSNLLFVNVYCSDSLLFFFSFLLF